MYSSCFYFRKDYTIDAGFLQFTTGPDNRISISLLCLWDLFISKPMSACSPLCGKDLCGLSVQFPHFPPFVSGESISEHTDGGGWKMTEAEKRHVTDLRVAGRSYQEIADETGLSLGAIKMYFMRCKEIPPVQRCEQCHKALRRDVIRCGRRFCSDKCRVKWWSLHPDRMKEKGKHRFTCENCGRQFFSRKPGKYCSRSCYNTSRRRGGKA